MHRWRCCPEALHRSVLWSDVPELGADGNKFCDCACVLLVLSCRCVQLHVVQVHGHELFVLRLLVHGAAQSARRHEL